MTPAVQIPDGRGGQLRALQGPLLRSLALQGPLRSFALQERLRSLGAGLTLTAAAGSPVSSAAATRL